MARPSAKTPVRNLDRGMLPSLLGYVLRRTQSAVFADFAATFAKAGEALTPGEFGLLVLVDRNAGLSQMALARALGIDRTHALGLTAAGEKALVKFAKLVAAHEKRIALALSAAETRKLIELLEKVRDRANA
jgi:hypothetical protein